MRRWSVRFFGAGQSALRGAGLLNILLKFTWQNIKENKFRTFLIIFSVMLSTALFFGSNALSGTIKGTYTDILKRDSGSAELMISPGSKSPSSFVSASQLNALAGEIQAAVGVLKTSGFFEKAEGELVNFQIDGYDLSELRKIHQLDLAQVSDLEPFQGRKIIISTRAAEQYGLKPGDTMDLEIRSERFRFKVVGLAERSGLFQENGAALKAVVPKDFLSNIFNIRNGANVLYIKLHDPAQKETFVNKLKELYPRYEVGETIPEADIREYSKRITQPFMMMVTTVMMMSVFIIYSSFKVIAMERIPVIGTFRSIGATRKMVNLVFLGESFLYGIIGGLLGSLFGIGVLYVMAKLTIAGLTNGQEAQVIFSFGQLLTAFGVALVLVLISSFFPVWKVGKIPVKDVVLNNIEPQVNKKRWKFVLGFIFLVMPLVLPALVNDELVIPVGTLCVILAMVGVILLIPFLVRMINIALGGIYSVLFGNEGTLALKNLRDNKSIVNNIALLAIGISSLFMIKVTGNTVLTEVTSFFQNWDFQILASPAQADRSVLASVRNVSGVQGVYGVLSANNVEVENANLKIGVLEGVNPQFFSFMDIEVPGSPAKAFEQLDSGRNILLSNMLRDRLGVNIGDRINLKMERGVVPYKVAGFINTIENNGQYALVSDRYLKMDMKKSYFTNLYIKTAPDVQQVQENLVAKFSRRPFWNDTVDNIAAINAQANGQMFNIMDAFSYLTILIGIFGVFNNFVISLLERRRSLAILRSVGLSKKQMVKMLIVEALSSGLIGGLTGLAGGLLAVSVVPYILKSMGLKGNLLFSVPLFWIPILVGVIISVISGVGPSLKSSKINIIESLKFD